MGVLPGVVGGWRAGRLLAAGMTLAALAAAAGCAQFDAALGQRQAIVSFRDNTPVSAKLVVRATCAKVPAVTPQPLPSDLNSHYAMQQLTYQVNQASDADVAKLEKCLAKFPVVAGVTLQDSSDEGN
ncbi:MAG TPA: hypothetical protein VHN16_10650 [Streptosporangiaceae bacterium]|nr:hypothetical protein [Streptosporangiaceae bacterium]